MSFRASGDSFVVRAVLYSAGSTFCRINTSYCISGSAHGIVDNGPDPTNRAVRVQLPSKAASTVEAVIFPASVASGAKDARQASRHSCCESTQ